MNPCAIAGIVLAVLLGVGGYWKGWSDRDARAQIANGKAATQSQQQAVAEQKPAVVAAEKLETENAEARIIYQTITQQVDRIVLRPEYRDRCLDDDGLRLARAAIAGSAPDTPKPDGAVHRPDAAH